MFEKFFVDFVLEFGSRAGRSLFGLLQEDDRRRKDFLKWVDQGLGVSEAARKVFGEQLDKVLEKANRPQRLNYKGNPKQYITLDLEGHPERLDRIKLLEAELAENLERLDPDTMSSEEIMNRACMIFDRWSSRYERFLEPSRENLKALRKVRELLDPEKKTARDIFAHLKPLFGASSALLLIYVAMLATATGLGVWASIMTFLGGIPGTQVLSLTVLAILMAYLALIPVKDEDKIQLVINSSSQLIGEEMEKEKLLHNLEKYLNSNKDKAMLTAIILKHMVMVDGRESEKEQEAFMDFFEGRYAMPREEVQRLYDNAPSVEVLESFLDEMKEILDRDDIEGVVKALKEISIADGVYHEEEVQFLKQVSERLGISAA